MTTDAEINMIENWTNDLIISLYNGKDKRWNISRSLKEAYLKGKEMK